MSENISLQNEEENVIVATFNIATENTTITLKNLTGMTQIDWGDGTVDNNLNHTYVAIGEYVCKIYDVTSIGYEAFKYCHSLTSVVIPGSVTSIGEGAFHYCRGLTSIEIPDSVTSIGNSAFGGCIILTSIEIPDSVTEIGSSAFEGCNSLTSVEIPDSVTTIGGYAFCDCKNLTSVVIGGSVMSIGGAAFRGCGSLIEITLPFVGAKAGVTADDTYQYPLGYLFGTRSYAGSIATKQFYYDSNTSNGKNITYYIPASLKSVTVTGGNILYGAFSNCSNLTSIEIGDNVTSIENKAFSGCSGLTSITIGKNVSNINAVMFSGCTSLANIIVSTDNILYKSIDGNIYNKDDTELILYAKGKKHTEFTIPTSVTSIGDYAFYYCDNLTSVVIPNSVTSIGKNAFQYCESLTSVVIPNSVTMISDEAFSRCYSLASVEIPDSVTTIGEHAFFCCESLANVKIPNSVTSIGRHAFAYCSSLTSVVIPDGVEIINEYAFDSCESLTSITIHNNVTTICNGAFGFCSSLIHITIPDSVTYVGDCAFELCESLTSVVIGSSVESIGGDAFDTCDKLTDVTFKNRTPLTVDILQNSKINQTNPTYYVPKKSMAAYQTAWGGVVAEEKIQPDPSEYLITLDGLKTYHNTLKEKYFDSMATQNWVQEQLVGKTDYLGTVNTIPNFPNAEAGDYCRVQTEFVYDGATGEKAHVGDVLIAVKDNPTQNIADWDLLHNELASATLVTVGGVAQTSWDADTKVGFTDYATADKAGVVRARNQFGISSVYVDGQGTLSTICATNTEIDAKTNIYKPIVPSNQDHAWKMSATDNKEEWSDAERQKARALIKAVATTDAANSAQIAEKIRTDKFLTPYYIDKIGVESLANCKDTTLWTDDTTDESGAVVQGTKTKARELLGAVGLTDYANYADSGLVIGNGGNQFRYFFQRGVLYLQGATDIQIENRQTYVGLTADNIDKAVKAGITTNTETLTDEEKVAIANWLASEDTKNYQLVSRSSAGHIAVPLTPNASYMATSKYYVDNNFVAKPTTDEEKVAACETIGAVKTSQYSKEQTLPNGSDGGVIGRIYIRDFNNNENTIVAHHQAIIYTVPVRNTNANFYVGTPQIQYECANKGYVDDNFVEAIKESEINGTWYVYGTGDKGERKLYQILDGIGAHFIPIRDAYGSLRVPEPKFDNQVTPKSYVDTLVGDINTVLEAIMGV